MAALTTPYLLTLTYSYTKASMNHSFDIELRPMWGLRWRMFHTTDLSPAALAALVDRLGLAALKNTVAESNTQLELFRIDHPDATEHDCCRFLDERLRGLAFEITGDIVDEEKNCDHIINCLLNQPPSN